MSTPERNIIVNLFENKLIFTFVFPMFGMIFAERERIYAPPIVNLNYFDNNEKLVIFLLRFILHYARRIINFFTYHIINKKFVLIKNKDSIKKSFAMALAVFNTFHNNIVIVPKFNI